MYLLPYTIDAPLSPFAMNLVVDSRSILKSKCLWLNNLTQSNDSQEVLRLYQNIWEDIKAHLQNSDLDPDVVAFVAEQIECAREPQLFSDVPFGCCFCYENDLVQQWNEYGDRGQGVSIGFDLDWFGIRRQCPITSVDINAAIGYEAVYYDSVSLRDRFFQIFYQAIREEGKTAWILSILPTLKHYAGLVKNPSFRDEKEIRMLFYPCSRFQNSFPGLSSLRTNKRDHYCLDWANGSSCAMRSVTVGYACEHSPEEVVALIDRAGIAGTENVAVNKSDCSYRSRANNI